jgi:hypothetical protein
MTGNKNEADMSRWAPFVQGWIGLAAWMTAGLLFEGLIGFRSPAYLQDPLRRELFQLAHAHGAGFSLLLIVAGICRRNGMIRPPQAAGWSLQIGTVLMPLGFLFGGIWHFGNDPGPGIFLAPVGGVMVLFGVVASAMSSFGRVEVPSGGRVAEEEHKDK